jgi:hypothetical protein
VGKERERAKAYRDRAEELRTLSEKWHDDFARGALEQVARQYEVLAERLEGETGLFDGNWEGEAVPRV